ncbi:MAG: transrane sensor [Gammaproteobacteria bacterium]|jgi:ferric-dicitrate binding protein FerR (iron transport regulator)|nr:transrane sensor [Gammaproteobacteria bacterium]
MTDERSQNSDLSSSEEHVLTSALQTPALSQQGLERVRAAVEREWHAATTSSAAAPKQRTALSFRVRWFAAAAAAVVAAVGVTFWVARQPMQAASLGSVSRTDEGALSVLSVGFPRRNLTQGGEFRVGDRVTAQGPALVALARGGTLRISAGSELAIISRSQITLERGLIYLDIPSEGGDGSPLRVVTDAGAVEHVGTEFEVKSDDEAVRVRVREGRIRFVGRTDTVVADAGTELLAAPGKTIVQRPIDTYGRDWSWTAALAPDYEIEGRSLIGFLRWVSRELGRPLNFADANARQIADRTILHGSVRHQAPIDAMSNVLATTSLTYEIRGDAIWVRSGTSAAL